MLRAVGWKDGDFIKPLVTVAVPHTNATPWYVACLNRKNIGSLLFSNAHINELGQLIEKAVEKEGGKSFSFGTPVVSDGETMGTEVFYCHLQQKLLLILVGHEILPSQQRIDSRLYRNHARGI